MAESEHALITWARAWFTAETAKGSRTFESVQAEFNAASPLLISLFNALTAANRDQTADLCDAIGRAYARAAAVADD